MNKTTSAILSAAIILCTVLSANARENQPEALLEDFFRDVQEAQQDYRETIVSKSSGQRARKDGTIAQGGGMDPLDKLRLRIRKLARELKKAFNKRGLSINVRFKVEVGGLVSVAFDFGVEQKSRPR